jgi:programmed cell death protein 5
VNRIALVNPQLSNRVELIIVRMAQSGQLRGRVTEAQLISLLDQADGGQSPTAAKKGAIVVSCQPPLASRSDMSQFQRRKDLDDDDWDI